MSNVWLTSDLHIGHKMVSEIRGFYREDESPTEFGLPITKVPQTDSHDEWIADLWDSVVKKNDQVWILGDISINGGQHALDWVEARPGIKHLISGNHDPVHPMDRRSSNKMSHWMKYFESIQPFARRKLDGVNFMMSHFPYWPGDRGEPRYEQYRLPNLGLPLLHGHTHSNEVFEFHNSFHVGIDAHRALVPLEDIQKWLVSGKVAA